MPFLVLSWEFYTTAITDPRFLYFWHASQCITDLNDMPFSLYNEECYNSVYITSMHIQRNVLVTQNVTTWFQRSYHKDHAWIINTSEHIIKVKISKLDHNKKVKDQCQRMESFQSLVIRQNMNASIITWTSKCSNFDLTQVMGQGHKMVLIQRSCKTRGPGALYRAQEYHCNLALFYFTWKVHKLM